MVEAVYENEYFRLAEQKRAQAQTLSSQIQEYKQQYGDVRGKSKGERAAYYERLRQLEKQQSSAARAEGRFQEKALYTKKKSARNRRVDDLRAQGFTTSEASQKVYGGRSKSTQSQPITAIEDTQTGEVFQGQTTAFASAKNPVFLGVRSVSQEEQVARRSRIDTPKRLPPGGAPVPPLSGGFTPYTPASYSARDKEGNLLEPGRPIYSSVAGFSTVVDGQPGVGEAFITAPSTRAPFVSKPTSATNLLKQDWYKGKTAVKEGRYIDALGVQQMSATRQVGGFLERKAEPGSYGSELGAFMKTDPEGFTTEFAVSAAVGAGTGFLGGKALTAVGSGKAGQFLVSKTGRSFGLATKWGVKSVGQAEKGRKIGTAVLGAGAVGAVGVTAYTGGTKGLARATPSFVGAGIGFGGGLGASGVKTPTFRVLKGRTTTPKLQSTKFGSGGTRVSIKGQTQTTGRFSAYGGARSVPVTSSFGFRGSQLGASGRYAGDLVTKSSARFGKQTYRTSSTSPQELNVGIGSFGGTNQGVTTSSLAGSTVLFGEGTTQGRSVFQFTVKGGKLLGIRKGSQIMDSGESALIKFSPMKETGGRGVLIQEMPSINRVATQYLSLGESTTAGVKPELGRGSRGRLARSLPETPTETTAFQSLFSPKETFSSSLFAPASIGRKGSAGGRARAILRPPETGYKGTPKIPGISTPFAPFTTTKPTFFFGGGFGGREKSFIDSDIGTNIIGKQIIKPATDTGQIPAIGQGEIVQIIPDQKKTPAPFFPELILTGGGSSTTGFVPPPTPPPPPPTVGGGVPIPFGIPTFGGLSPLPRGGRGFKYNQDFTSSIFNIKGKKKKGLLSGFELRPGL